MADFDFLDGFDELGGDFGFTSVASKPSDKAADTKQTQEAVKQAAEGVGKAVSSDIVNNNDCGHGPGPLQTNEDIAKELDIAGFKDITLRNYSLDDEGIHLVRCKKE